MVMWQGAVDVQSGRISGGTIAAFVLTGGLVAGAFGALTEVYGDLLRGAGAAGRLAELLSEEPEIRAPAVPQPLPEPGRGALEFRAVTFRYPTRREVSALHDFSLDVAPGETVAVVGPSGAGKSTLFQLAQRFYDPEAGEVRLDGVPLPEADPHDGPRAHRDGAAGHGDLRRLGPRQSALRPLGRDRTTNCGRRPRPPTPPSSCAKLPDGLDTFMGEGGARLSGGQRQRSPSPGRCFATRRCCCSTRRPRRSTPKASGSSRPRSSG